PGVLEGLANHLRVVLVRLATERVEEDPHRSGPNLEPERHLPRPLRGVTAVANSAFQVEIQLGATAGQADTGAEGEIHLPGLVGGGTERQPGVAETEPDRKTRAAAGATQLDPPACFPRVERPDTGRGNVGRHMRPRAPG